tara:strand:+ start:1226 stop:2932 length:1707 start_codon:yes stop_codon:yes gene_type:complete
MIKHKVKDIINFTTGIMVITVVLIVSYLAYQKIDLTADKRFTLSNQTVQLVEDLEDVVEFKIYITGKHIPTDLARVKSGIQEILEEIAEISDDNIEFEFIDLYGTIEDKDELHKELLRLQKKGIRVIPFSFNNNKGEQEHINLPLGGEVFYGGKSLPISIIKNVKGGKDKTYEKAIESLEYEVSNVIRRLKNKNFKKVAILQGHNELGRYDLQDLSVSLMEYYQVGPIYLRDQTGKEQLNALDKIDVLIIAKPKSRFSQREQYILDQFVMNGGKTLWLMDGTNGAELDSMQQSGLIYANPLQTGLETLLYKYGVKVNTDVIEDLQCSKIPIQATANGDRGKLKLHSWIYSPVLTTKKKHLITNNLDPIKLEFASTLDSVPSKDIKHTVLYQTSGKNRYKRTPTRIGFEETAHGLNIGLFKAKAKPVAMLLEGSFSSYFTNRIAPSFANDPNIKFRNKSEQSKMIIISDGDIAKNWFTTKGELIPIGKDQYTQYFFDNKKLILNCINYLTDDKELISVRSKHIKMRLLDRKLIKENRVLIEVLNMAVPSGIIILISLIFFVIRRVKYTR